MSYFWPPVGVVWLLYANFTLFSSTVERELLAERELSSFARQYDRTLANI